MKYPKYIHGEYSLPYLVFPMTSTIETTVKYLGKRAYTGEEYFTVKFMSINKTQSKAFFEFWENEINFGTEPFLIPAPFRDLNFIAEDPNVLVRFVDGLNPDKDTGSFSFSAKLKVIEYREHLGVLFDKDLYKLIDQDGLYLASNSNFKTNSNKEIKYG